jgi:hypothetical protein
MTTSTSGCASPSTSDRVTSADPSMPAAGQPTHVSRLVTWLVLLLLAVSAPLGVAARAADVDFRRDPSVVFVVVALLMGAAAIGLAFPITWSLRTKQMPPPPHGMGHRAPRTTIYRGCPVATSSAAQPMTALIEVLSALGPRHGAGMAGQPPRWRPCTSRLVPTTLAISEPAWTRRRKTPIRKRTPQRAGSSGRRGRVSSVGHRRRRAAPCADRDLSRHLAY